MSVQTAEVYTVLHSQYYSVSWWHITLRIYNLLYEVG